MDLDQTKVDLWKQLWNYTKWSAWSGLESAHFGVIAHSCFSVICVYYRVSHLYFT